MPVDVIFLHGIGAECKLLAIRRATLFVTGFAWRATAETLPAACRRRNRSGMSRLNPAEVDRANVKSALGKLSCQDNKHLNMGDGIARLSIASRARS